MSSTPTTKTILSGSMQVVSVVVQIVTGPSTGDCQFTSYMPDVNWKIRDASEQFIDDALWWLETYDLDGLRLMRSNTSKTWRLETWSLK